MPCRIARAMTLEQAVEYALAPEGQIDRKPLPWNGDGAMSRCIEFDQPLRVSRVVPFRPAGDYRLGLISGGRRERR